MLVLLAEDSDTLRAALTKQIKALGHEVHPVPDGWQAVLCFHAYKYDIILMDMHMPVMDGWDATQTIRNLEGSHQKARTPIVAVTSLFDRQACLAGGMDDYMSKPYSPMEVYAVLRRWSMKQAVPLETAEPLEQPVVSEEAETTEVTATADATTPVAQPHSDTAHLN